jgi:hypothetical protein
MASDNKGAMTRAAISVGPPVANGTTKRTVLFCADAKEAHSNSAVQKIRRVVINTPSFVEKTSGQ